MTCQTEEPKPISTIVFLYFYIILKKMTYYRYYLLVINKYDNMSFYHKLLLRINGLSYSFDLLILK